MEHPSSLDVCKITAKLGDMLDIIRIETGGPTGRHIKLLVDIDLTKPLQRGTSNSKRYGLNSSMRNFLISVFIVDLLGMVRRAVVNESWMWPPIVCW